MDLAFHPYQTAPTSSHSASAFLYGVGGGEQWRKEGGQNKTNNNKTPTKDLRIAKYKTCPQTFHWSLQSSYYYTHLEVRKPWPENQLSLKVIKTRLERIWSSNSSGVLYTISAIENCIKRRWVCTKYILLRTGMRENQGQRPKPQGQNIWK